MAVLVAVGGAALTSALGLGWQAGWIAGAALGGLAFGGAGRQTVRGPRLSDLRVTSSAYGAAIPVVYGAVRIGGNIIWSSGIRERKRTQTQGKGGAGARTVSYTYSASFAVAFCEGPVADVLRIWADGKLVYDKTTATETATKPGLEFRFYKGDETQLPDPAIEADVGAGNAPAHRGLCYIVFEDLPLADYGNRIPNITAEIATEASAVQTAQAIDFLTSGEGGKFSPYQTGHLAVDWRRGFGYFATVGSGTSDSGLRRFNLTTMVEDRQASIAEISPGETEKSISSLHVGPGGFLYMSLGGTNSQPIVKVEPNGMREVARFGYNSAGTGNATDRFAFPERYATVSAWGPNGRADFLLVGSTTEDVGLLRADDLAYVWGAGQTVDEARVAGIVAGRVAEGFGEGWVLGSDSVSSHTNLALYRITVAWNATYEIATGLSVGVVWEKVATFAPTDFEAGATAFFGEPTGFVYDRADNAVVFLVAISNGGVAGQTYAVKWRDGAIVWVTAVPFAVNFDGSANNNGRIEGPVYTIMSASSRAVGLRLTDGAVVRDETWAAISVNGAQSYDGLTDSMIVNDQATGWNRLFFGRSAGGEATLAGIVADLCGRAGLAAGDIDTSELADTVPGYVVSRPMPVREALEPLAQAFFFDAVESDDVLAFRLRGKAPVATLTEQDLVPLDPDAGEIVRERRAQEVELPERVSVVYLDPAQDYSTGTQQAKRPAAPVATTGTRDQLTVQLPMALAASKAKQIAEKALYTAWVERVFYEARVAPSWLRLEPTDVVQITIGVVTHRVRITRADIGADLDLVVEGVSEEPATYASSAQADAGGGAAQVIPGAWETRLFAPDIPLLRDVDDTAGSASRVYLAGAGYTEGWPGAAVYRSTDRTLWSVVGRAVEEVAWGVVLDALGAPASPFATDEANEITVAMVTGEDRLVSVTQTQMLDGANAALLLRPDGTPEIVQFRDVTANADGTFTLRGLLRGRRGTDVYVSGHAAGETFVLLGTEWESTTIPLGDLGATRYWRAVGFGQLFEEADIETRVHTGRDLKPYAPVHGKAVTSGAGPDIVLSWVRRTRIGGELRDGTGDVPLAEASESYEVEILDAPGGNVLRTLTSSAPSVTYANADIIADFGSVPGTLSFVVYQMSAAVGRGFPGTFTVEVQ